MSKGFVVVKIKYETADKLWTAVVCGNNVKEVVDYIRADVAVVVKVTNIETMSEVHGITGELKKRLRIEKESTPLASVPTEVIATYKCPYCPDGKEKAFSTATSLKIHIGKMHKEV